MARMLEVTRRSFLGKPITTSINLDEVTRIEILDIKNPLKGALIYFGAMGLGGMACIEVLENYYELTGQTPPPLPKPAAASPAAIIVFVGFCLILFMYAIL